MRSPHCLYSRPTPGYYGIGRVRQTFTYRGITCGLGFFSISRVRWAVEFTTTTRHRYIASLYRSGSNRFSVLPRTPRRNSTRAAWYIRTPPAGWSRSGLPFGAGRRRRRARAWRGGGGGAWWVGEGNRPGLGLRCRLVACRARRPTGCWAACRRGKPRIGWACMNTKGAGTKYVGLGLNFTVSP